LFLPPACSQKLDRLFHSHFRRIVALPGWASVAFEGSANGLCRGCEEDSSNASGARSRAKRLVRGSVGEGTRGAKRLVRGSFGEARSVILVFASGGQSQLETWDPKPDAPEEIRGAFGSIATSVPGTRLCEHLPRLARLADRYTIVRSVSHDDGDHGSAAYLAL